MKKLIRSSVFETNSSSSHSISIADETKEFVLDTIYPDQNGVIELTGGEFGWEWFKHNDSLTKANYAAVDFNGDDSLIDMLVEVLQEQTGAEEVKFLFTGDYSGPNWAYIDHDSAGTTPRTKSELRNFIFNKNSWLFGGNDNSTAHPTFYDVPEFKEGKQILPEYTHELRIEGYNKTAKFKKKPTKEQVEEALDSLLQDVRLLGNGYFDDDNSLMAQITRNDRNSFEFNSYQIPIDHKKKLAGFISKAWSDAHDIWKKEYGTHDWSSELGYKKCREIEKSLYEQKDSPYVKKVKFSIDKL